MTDLSTLPVGQMWEDKVCIQDPSFYLSCKLFNGVISGELQQCPPGKLFDQNAVKPWDKICVPASECQMKKCPDWIQKMALMKSEFSLPRCSRLFRCVRFVSEGLSVRFAVTF